jgi:hypothetical protein
MSRLLADENFPLPTVQELRRLGHDVVTVQERGKGHQQMPDKEVKASSNAFPGYPQNLLVRGDPFQKFHHSVLSQGHHPCLDRSPIEHLHVRFRLGETPDRRR